MSFAELIKERLSIAEALEIYTGADLSRVKGGRSISIRCPFHHDRHPSFSIKPDENIWRCWSGCGGGDVISLVATAYKISNGQAIRLLSKDLGLDTKNKKMRRALQQKTKQKTYEEKLLKKYDERFQFAFTTLLKLEYELNDKIEKIPSEEIEKYAYVYHILPMIGHWLDSMVEGQFEEQVQAVICSENFLRRWNGEQIRKISHFGAK